MARTLQSARKKSPPVKKTPGHLSTFVKKKERKKKIEKTLKIPKALFHRIVKRITLEQKPYTLSNRWSTAALSTLQEIAELYIARLFQDSYLVTQNRNAQTLGVKDIQVTRRLRGELNIPPDGGWKSYNEGSKSYTQSALKFVF